MFWVEKNELAWLVTFVAIFVAMISLFNTLILTGRIPQHLPTLNDGEKSLSAKANYFLQSPPDIILIGTSLLNRIQPEYFSNLDIQNLSTSGGSPLTALKIVANRPRKPKIIVIEVNILDRNTDEKIVKRLDWSSPVLKYWPTSKKLFKPTRVAVSYIVGMDEKHSRWEKSLKSTREKLLSQKPRQTDNSKEIVEILKVWGARHTDTVVRRHMVELNNIVSKLESDGVNIYFIEMPYEKPLEDVYYARMQREIVKEIIGNNYSHILKIGVDQSQLRWDDAIHLDKRSTLLFADTLESKLVSLLKSTDRIE